MTRATTQTAPIPLTDLAQHAASGEVEVPAYDRQALRPAVVHFGVGGFHRAHQALYFDELAQRGISQDWGVVGVGMHRREMKEVLSQQDHLFTVVERGDGHERARVVGSVLASLHAPEEPDAVLEALTDERTKLVTLTVTGTAYPVDPETLAFRPDAETTEDLRDPHHPATVFGFLVEGLRRRRDAGTAPFTVLSCDNAPANGASTRAAVLGYAGEVDGALAGWIDEHVAFPSSMVDRITPATSPEDRDEIAERYGVDDGWPVLTEPFSQWIIEDRFCNERPPLDLVGVQFVEDVHPYELMKTRLLNGGHCALGYYGLLLGHTASDEAMRDATVRSFVAAHLDQVIPLLPPVPGIDLHEYRDVLLARFANPEIGDQLERLARRGSTKLATYVLPSIVDARRQGHPHDLLTLTVAGWIRALEGTDEWGREISVQDPRLEELRPFADAGDVPSMAYLGVFGSLGNDAEFVEALQRALDAVREHGPRAVLKAAVGPTVRA
jgi:fructuronate reductase/mannitol 2-dehydrogenase